MFWKPKITSKEIKLLLIDAGYVDYAHPPIWGIFDRSFKLASDAEYQAVINKDLTNLRKYEPEIGDCDNYAFELRSAYGRKGWACGVLAIYSEGIGAHAIFFYVTDKREIKLVEPQTDRAFSEKSKVTAVIMY